MIALLDPPEDLALRSGMSARADIFLGDGVAKLAVPVEAVGSEEGEDGDVERFVWVDRDGSARRVVVQVGLSDDRWEEITSGLDVGDRVIVGPARTLRDLQDGDAVVEAKAGKDEDEDDDKDDEEEEEEDEVSFS